MPLTPQSIATLSKGPVLLAADNFTPLSRTPWAGESIATFYKQKLIPNLKQRLIGESWEFSCDPDFPSKLQELATTLPELIAAAPEVLLGKSADGSKPSCEVLVKLLNASSPLSLQVHPEDNHPSLKPNECGKPESWLVLRAEQNSGLYLGFAKALSKEALKAALISGEDIKDLLQFVTVRAGDYFEIEPGVPHAIGPGVTLLEPQRIILGKSGKTYRLWDWGRRYDAKGGLDMEQGKARELHLEQGLELVNSLTQVGMGYVKSTQRQPTKKLLDKGSTLLAFPKNPYYQVFYFEGRPQASIAINSDCYGALIVLEGSIQSAGIDHKIHPMMGGQPAFLPASAMPVKISCLTEAKLALVVPANSNTQIA